MIKLATTLSILTYLSFLPTHVQAQTSNPAPIAGMTCTSKPLANGRPGENVMVCTKTVPSRLGVTIVVARLGR